ncbi:MAG TPA: N-6 DNA methylase [Candidatus Acidoferrales bacterium]|nr:N-6 DNA methylase [Candidatus Acidoferrales bacterium]
MTDVLQFKTVDAWRTALGLLPVPLRDTAEKQERYVLLNGTNGNFCLDFVGEPDPNTQRAIAWSCDVGHYVTCTDETVVVNRSDKDAVEESYSTRSVIAQLHQFHRHLEKTSPDRSRSIVVHVLRIFHRIRAVIGDEENGLRSLRILLHLLGSAAAGHDRLSEQDFGAWGLAPETVELSKTIAEATWRPLYNDLLGIGRYDVLRPDFQLVLRHASGAVFQDAHLEANNSPAFWLPGFELPATVDANAVPTETGIYFTPPALARTLAEEATSHLQNVEGRPLLLFDPACGSGELLKECLRLLKLSTYLGRVRVVGWDKSPAAVEMARFVLAWEKRAWPADQIEVEVTRHDSLTAESWPIGVDILVMNPPFLSWQLMEPEQQAVVTRILSASSKPNLAMAFARRALEVLGESGVLAMIAPNSLLEGVSGKDTREAMAESLNPQLVARLGDQSIFARALVDAGLYVGRRKPSRTDPAAILWADSRQNSLNRALRGLRRWRGTEAEPINGDGFSVYVRKDIATTGDPWVARGYDAWSQYQRFQHSEKTQYASKVFDIRQGARLGNDIFIMPRDYVKRLGKSEQRFFRPAVMNPSIVDGKLSDAYYVFYPYTRGLPLITSEKELQKNVPNYFKDHLSTVKETLKARKTLEGQTGLKWWDLLRPRAWQKERNAKIVSKYFGGKRSFAVDKTGDFVVVVGNAWILKAGEIEHEITDEEVYFAVLTYLNSSTAYDMLEYLSIQVSGGQLDLSNKYVGKLPLLDLNPKTVQLFDLTELIRMGVAISEGRVERWADVDDLISSIMNR